MKVRILPLPSSIILVAVLAVMGLTFLERKPVVTSASPSFAPLVEPKLVEQSIGDDSTVSDVDYVSDILERPIFEPNRRPLVEPEQVSEPIVIKEQEPEEQPEPQLEVIQIVEVERLPPPDFQLGGVLLHGPHMTALLSADGAEPAWVELGASIFEWKLQAIYPNYVELVNGSESIRLFLHSEE